MFFRGRAGYDALEHLNEGNHSEGSTVDFAIVGKSQEARAWTTMDETTTVLTTTTTQEPTNRTTLTPRPVIQFTVGGAVGLGIAWFVMLFFIGVWIYLMKRKHRELKKDTEDYELMESTSVDPSETETAEDAQLMDELKRTRMEDQKDNGAELRVTAK